MHDEIGNHFRTFGIINRQEFGGLLECSGVGLRLSDVMYRRIGILVGKKAAP